MRTALTSEISVFLALITAVMISLIFAAVENVRTGAAQTYLCIAADSAVDSLFSQYHLELWEKYRLLGVEMYSGKEVTEEYYEFLKPYLNGGETRNWYCLSAGEEDILVNEYQLLTDRNGEVFENQVLSYMKYGMVLDLAGLDSTGQTAERVQTAKQVGSMAGALETGSREARKLNESLEDLSEAVKEHNLQVRSAASALSLGSGAQAELRKLQGRLETAEQKAALVRIRAKSLENAVERTRTDLETKRNAGELTQEAFDTLSGELDSYEAYSREQGEKLQELEALEIQIEENGLQLRNVLPAAEEAAEYIRCWTPSQILVGYTKPKKEGEEPEPIYEDEVLDTNAVWQPVRESFEGYEELDFAYETAKIDREKAGKLDGVSNLLKGNLMKMIYPGAERLSKEEMDLSGCPSSLFLEKKTGLFSASDYVLNRLAVDEYAMLELSHVGWGKETGAAEIEYVLCGKKSDVQNVSSLITELTALRTGLNLGYLMTNPECMEAASALAVAVTGGTVAAPIAQTAILLVWATAQAVLDVRELYSGGKVPFMHTVNTFRLSLEGMLNNFSAILKEGGSSGTGMDYEGWLRTLLTFRSGSQTDYRIMDIIQVNLRKEQSDFRMDRLYTAAEVTVDAESLHLFSLWNSQGGKTWLQNQNYPVKATVYYGY